MASLCARVPAYLGVKRKNKDRRRRNRAGNSRSVCLQSESKTPFIFEMEYGQNSGCMCWKDY